MKDLWELLDAPDCPAPEARFLFRWSLNYEHRAPWNIYLDLTGWSDETLGESASDPNDRKALGYLELAYLADALAEFADRPKDVFMYIDEIMSAEG